MQFVAYGDFLSPPMVIDPIDDRYQAADTRKFEGIPSLAVTPSGRIWVTWYAGKTPDEDSNNYVILARSENDGLNWRELFVVDPDMEGPVRAFDPELWVDPKGHLWLFWAQHDVRAKYCSTAGVWAMSTNNPDDSHPKWTLPKRLTDGIMMCKPTVLSDNQWILPVSTWRTTDNSAKVFALIDKGDCVKYIGAVNVPASGRDYDEHMIIERKDGSLWMLVRTNYGIGESVSLDRGCSWSTLTPSCIKHPSSRFFIRRLCSGNLLLVKNGPLSLKTDRSQLMAFLSEDDGTTWTEGFLLDERKSVSYPDGQQDENGVIYITYDYSRTECREILLAHFTERDVLEGKIVSGKAKLQILVNKDQR